MKRTGCWALALLVSAGLLALAAHRAAAQAKALPGKPYKEVCKLVQLPSFLPSMGTLYVDPSTRGATDTRTGRDT
jgi:hypothetical protein